MAAALDRFWTESDNGCHPLRRAWQMEMRRTLAVAFAVGLLSVGGCSTSGLPLPGSILGYAAECPGATQPMVYGGAAPYNGAGPHPVAFVDASGNSQGSSNNPFFNDQTDPSQSAPDGTFSTEPNAWIPRTVASVQLVGCVVDNGLAQPTTIAADCGNYTTGPHGMDYESYTITLVNAKTGEQVGHPVTLAGRDIPPCPFSYANNGYNAFGTILTASQAESALGGFIS